MNQHHNDASLECAALQLQRPCAWRKKLIRKSLPAEADQNPLAWSFPGHSVTSKGLRGALSSLLLPALPVTLLLACLLM